MNRETKIHIESRKQSTYLLVYFTFTETRHVLFYLSIQKYEDQHEERVCYICMILSKFLSTQGMKLLKQYVIRLYKLRDS